MKNTLCSLLLFACCALAQPSIYIDTPQPGATTTQTFTVQGWAIENTSSVGLPISSVQVYIDGQFSGTATYGVYRPDVCAAYPGRPGCPYVGFSYSLTLTPGNHSLGVFAFDTNGVSSESALGFSVAVAGLPPLVQIDIPANGSTVAGPVTVSGWTLDNATVINGVQVLVDGSPVGTATYGIYRPDVCNVYPGRPGCPNVGYSFTWDSTTVAPGNHTITVSAADADPSPDSGSGSVVITIPTPTTDMIINELPVGSGDVVTDDFTGGTMTMPTSDVPQSTLEFVTSQDGTGHGQDVVSPSDTYTLVIRFAPPNAPVYTFAESFDAPQTLDTSTFVGGWCIGPSGLTFAPGGTSSTPGSPCLMGYTDSTGFFGFSGNFSQLYFLNNPDPASWREKWWVGGTADANLAGTIGFAVFPNGIPSVAAEPIKVTMSDKSVRTFPRADQIRASASAVHEAIANGEYRYTFTLDGRDAAIIRVGHETGYRKLADRKHKLQNGWFDVGMGWIAVPDEMTADVPRSTRHERLQFEIETSWLPGPVAVMFQGPIAIGSTNLSPVSDDPVAVTLDNVRITSRTGIFENSVRKLVIGPGINPAWTRAELVHAVKSWMGNLNLGFLLPLTVPGADLSATLAKLNPGTDFEHSVVDCLRNALPVLKLDRADR